MSRAPIVQFLLFLALVISQQCASGAPFIFKPRIHKSATKAYLERLQNELEAAQSQLYTSQKTCVALRKRVDGQRKNYIPPKDDDGISNASLMKVEQQNEEIHNLKSQLQSEMEKVQKQMEQMKLLEDELKEVQEWKENEGSQHSKSTLSDQMQDEYEQQIELLSLKLEAAELAAETGRNKESRAGNRTEQLKTELEQLRKRYSKLAFKLTGGEDTKEQKQLEEDMDQAIQSVFQTAVESIEDDWEKKYQSLQLELNEVSELANTLKSEKDEALHRLEVSPSPDQEQGLREKLTDELTAELTEKITEQLTEELTTKIERRLRKKYKKLQKELQSEASNEDNQQMLQAEVEKIKMQYESEYGMKMKLLQEQNEKQLELQKERMRKLVRALLEREAKEKQKSLDSAKVEDKSKADSGNTSGQKVTKRKKRKVNVEEEFVTSTSSSARKQKPKTGVTPVRGNAVK